MKLIVDKDLPDVENAFGPLGDVQYLGTSSLTPAIVRDVDGLVVRSTTRIDASLLEGSKVKFVGTATIGMDHVDTDYLASRGITFASAPGSNSNSVKEYVVAALLGLSVRSGRTLKGSTIGVVGVGHVGSKVAAAAKTLGMSVLLNDPPLARKTGDPQFLPLENVFAADVVTLHVPLTKSGPDPTYHLFDAARLNQLKKGSILINTSRGAVVETTALKNAIVAGHLSHCVIDVWENEPDIDVELLRLTTIGTPHIAGYSMEGKTNAVRMIREALCVYSGMRPERNVSPDSRDIACDVVTLTSEMRSPESILRQIVLERYDIMKDDTLLRSIFDREQRERKKYFAGLRSQYRTRYEFARTSVRVPREHAHLVETIAGLGFSIAHADVGMV